MKTKDYADMFYFYSDFVFLATHTQQKLDFTFISVDVQHRVVDKGISSHVSNMNFQFWAVLGSLTFWVFNDTNLTCCKDF